MGSLLVTPFTIGLLGTFTARRAGWVGAGATGPPPRATELGIGALMIVGPRGCWPATVGGATIPNLANEPWSWLASLLSLASKVFVFLSASLTFLSSLSFLSCTTHPAIPSTACSGSFLHVNKYPCSSAVENSCSGTPSANFSANLCMADIFSGGERSSLVLRLVWDSG